MLKFAHSLFSFLLMKKFYLFCLLIFTALSAQSGLFDRKPAFLKVDDAFRFSGQRVENSPELIAHWDIAEGYYLYQDKIQAKKADSDQTFKVIFNQSAALHQDPYFGEVAIFPQNVEAIFSAEQLSESDQIEISYQGCAEGFCYPPESKILRIGDLPITKISAKTTEKSTALLSEQESLAQQLFQSQFAFLGFFLLGLGLAFTPCVLPMLPLLSAVVIGQQTRPTTARAFALSFLYVQGMALTYTLLGLAVAAIGLPFQIALQHSYVMLGLSILFTLLALSMFGLFTLQLPSRWQTKLTLLSQQQKAGALGGVFVMGMIAGLVASPCTSAPLSGALLYVAQSGDLLKGGLTLYFLALGMGVPLMLMTLFGNKILPKSGNWLNGVKRAFGFVMLALPVFLLSRVLPAEWEPRLWAILLTAFFAWLALQMPKNGVGYALKVLSFVAAMIAVQPLQQWVWQLPKAQSAVENPQVLPTKFQRIETLTELEQALAANPHSVAMLDLYADWCVACKEFERHTFHDLKVQQAFSQMLLLQVDMTKNSEENQAIMTRFNVLGLPTILFFDKSGQEIKGSRVTGFMAPEPFLAWLKQLY